MRSILLALVILGIIPVAASAATNPVMIKVGLAVTAKQADGTAYPLYGGEIPFFARLSRPLFYEGQIAWNGSDDKPPVALNFKVRVGDNVKICQQDRSLGFTKSRCQEHKFVRADAGRMYVFSFKLTWRELTAHPDLASTT